MNEKHDFRLWKRELIDFGIVDEFPTRMWKRVAIGAGAVTLLGVLGIGVEQKISNMNAGKGEPHSANPATFTYSYDTDSVTATIPTPHATSGKESMTVVFSCDSNGSLRMENAVMNLSAKLTAANFESMEAYHMIEKSPCEDGLTADDTKDLGDIARSNNLANYYTAF